MTEVDNNCISIGAGWLGDPAMRKMMSPERWEAEQAALERERKQLEEEAEVRRAEVSERAWMALRRGEQRHTVAEKLAEVAAASERADRREQAREHRRDCGCETCGSRLAGSGVVALTKRLPTLVDKSIAESEEAFMNQPASVGLVDAMVAKVEAKVDRLFGKRRPRP